MEIITATTIASLSLVARLIRWQIATFLILGLLSIALAGWAVYSYYGGQRCSSEVGVITAPMPNELHANLRRLLAIIEKSQGNPKLELTDSEKRILEFYEGWTKQLAELQTQCKEKWSMWRWFSMIDPISSAHAEIKFGSYDQDSIRGMVIVSIFAALAVFFFVSVGAILFSANAAVVSFAMDSIKSLLGFFIGVAMSFMGISH